MNRRAFLKTVPAASVLAAAATGLAQNADAPPASTKEPASSLGLAAWFHNCDKAALAAELKLRPDQRVLFAQTVGYPA